MESSKDMPNSNRQNNDISLRDVIIEIQRFSKILWNRKWFILVVTLVGALLGLGASYIIPKKYIAKLSFVLESNSTNPFAAYAGLAGQFGIDLSSKGESSLFEGDNIMEFLRSRLIVEKALLTPIKYKGKQITLAERYIEFSNLREDWEDDKFDVKFPVGQDRKSFTIAQDSILNILQERVTKKNLTIDKIDKKLSFILVSTESPREEFSKEFTEAVVTEAINFYTDTKTKQNKTNVLRLQAQADSIKQLLNGKTHDAANLLDLNQNPARAVASVNAEIGMRDKMILQTMYLEIVKNLEISKIALEKETPVIQIIDQPILPLKTSRLGKLKGIVIGGFVFGFLATLTILLKSAFRQIMDGNQ